MAQRIGILTSGGDCPGLNPAIVAVAGRLEALGAVPVGVPNGYVGLCALADTGGPGGGGTVELRGLDASRWVREGGSMLGNRRLKLHKDRDALDRAVAGAARAGLDALVVLGGDGSLQGALALHDAGLPTVGVPKTIDRDVAATDATIGFASAVETGCETTERIATSAHSHGLAFLVEVMGRRSGALAAAVARSAGADGLLVPECPADYEEVRSRLLSRDPDRGCLVVMAEGFWPEGLKVPAGLDDGHGRIRLGDASRSLERLLCEDGADVRSTRLGHSLRGGRPCAADRLLAHALGTAAAKGVVTGAVGSMAVTRNGGVALVPLDEARLPRRTLLDAELDALDDLLW